MAFEQTPITPPRDIITSVPTLDRLSQYEQAAANSGYKVTVIAREGENYTSWTPLKDASGMRTGGWTPITEVVMPGRIAIAIEKSEDQISHSPFWRAYEALTPESYRKTMRSDLYPQK